MKLKNKNYTKNDTTILIISLLVILLVGMFAISKMVSKEIVYIGNTERDTIYFSGEAKESSAPDELDISFTIEAKADTSEEAYKQANEILKKIKNEFNNKNYELKTLNYRLIEDKEYDYNQQKYIFKGYKITHSLLIKTKKLDESGNILSKLTELGVNNINYVQFQLSDELKQELYNKALNKAIREAKEKAKSTSNALGVDISKIVSFSESQYIPYYRNYAFDYMPAMKQENFIPEDLPAGDVEITARVTIGYLIN